jgi:hypothetical protein
MLILLIVFSTWRITSDTDNGNSFEFYKRILAVYHENIYYPIKTSIQRNWELSGTKQYGFFFVFYVMSVTKMTNNHCISWSSIDMIKTLLFTHFFDDYSSLDLVQYFINSLAIIFNNILKPGFENTSIFMDVKYIIFSFTEDFLSTIPSMTVLVESFFLQHSLSSKS